MARAYYKTAGPTRARGLRRNEAWRCSIAMSGSPRPQPEEAANVPAAGIARVERQCTVDERHRRADVLAECPGRHPLLRGLAWRNRCPSGGPPRDLRSARPEAVEHSRMRPRRGLVRNPELARSPAR